MFSDHSKHCWPRLIILLFVLCSVTTVCPSQAQGFPFPILDVEWKPTGDMYAVIDDHGGVEVIDSTTAAPIFKFAGAATLWGAAVGWNPDGNRLAAGIGYQIYIWDTATWQLIAQYAVGNSDGQAYSELLGDLPEGIVKLSWSKEGRFVASTSVSALTKVWDSQGSTIIYSGDDNTQLMGRAWLNNGLLSDGFSDLNPLTREITRLDRSQYPYVGGGAINAIDISPNRLLLAQATEAGFVKLIDPYALIFTRPVEVAPSLPAETSRAVQDISWDGSGNFIAAVTRDGEIRIVNLTTQQVETVGIVSGTLHTVDWNPKSNQLLYGGANDAGEAILATVDVSGIAGVPTATETP